MPPSREQEELIASLARRSEKLARIYSSGLSVFSQRENPGRLELTAHALRELMEKCPILTGREFTARGDGMKNRIQPVKDAYSTLRKTQGFGETVSESFGDGAARPLFIALDRFFEWMEANRPEANRRIAEMLGELSGPGQPLPVDISENAVARWMAADEYFKKVSHNGQDHVNEDEFMVHMGFVERILLQRLQPRAVGDLDAIDALVREAENGH
jgi:hypothetical protein